MHCDKYQSTTSALPSHSTVEEEWYHWYLSTKRSSTSLILSPVEEKSTDVTRSIPLRAASLLAKGRKNSKQEDTAYKTHIIYLKGTCSSGKSSSTHAFREDSRWVVIDEDRLVIAYYVEFWKKAYPEELAIIEHAIEPHNIFIAIKRNMICFREGASFDDQKNAKEALSSIQKKILSTYATWKLEPHKEIRECIEKKIEEAEIAKKQVLLDSWFYTSQQIQQLFPKTIVSTVMLYSPLDICIERLRQRNLDCDRKSDFREKRYKHNVLLSFFSLYALSSKPKGSITEISKNALRELFLQIDKDLSSDPSYALAPIEKEISKEAFQRSAAEFLKPFEESTSEILYLVPKSEQDLIVNSSLLDKESLGLFLKKALSILIDPALE